MKKFIVILALLATSFIGGTFGFHYLGPLIFPPFQTNIEKNDHEITSMLKEMKYNEYRNIPNNQFGYLIDRIRDSERAGKVVQFGEEEFKVFYYEDSTESYPYHLDGKTFSVYINPKSVFPDHFVMMKTWDFPSQDKYNK